MAGTSTGSVHLLALLFRFAHKTAQKVLRKLQVFASSPREVRLRSRTQYCRRKHCVAMRHRNRKAERAEASKRGREPGSRKFPSDGEEIIRDLSKMSS
jgi:hypothetical protein